MHVYFVTNRQGVRLTRREAMKNIGRFFLNPDRGGISDIRPLLSVWDRSFTESRKNLPWTQSKRFPA